MSKHYEVVVLGQSIGALTAAVLLARRGFTVLVLGQGERPSGYKVLGRTLERRAFTLLAATSPAFRRVVVELAQSQTWKRRATPLTPMMQVLAPRRRLSIPPDAALWTREIDREFPELRRIALELYADLARVNGAADDAFERDAVWPPGTFWERRETGRYAAMLPYVRAEPDADLLVEFPRAHAFRQVVLSSVLFATDLAALPPPFAVARLHGAWTRGVMSLPGGERELEEFLVERIEAHGGRCMLGHRALRIALRRGGVSGVLVDGDEHPTGCEFVLTDLTGEEVAALAGGEGISKRAQREWPRITTPSGRFVVSLVVRTEGLPEPLGAESFVLPARPKPVVHLERRGEVGPGETLLVAETILPDRGGLALHEARDAVVSALATELPFLERHLVLVDSPHDGLPAWVYEEGKRKPVERLGIKESQVGAEPMVRKLAVDPPGYLGLAGEPIRGPINRTLLVGRSVLPGLGQEGQLLAAWSAARLVTRTDRRKERMRREMWSKVEIG